MAELFEHETNALVFEAENPVDLAEKLERMISDNDLRRGLVMAARRQMERDFTIQGYAEKMEQFVIRAAQG